jgi:long-chain fatty acid transport protein
MAGAQIILPSIKFDTKQVGNTRRLPRFAGPVEGNSGGNAGEIAAVPSFFYVRPLSDRARFGFSLTGPLGGGVDYGNDFVGRYSIKEVMLAGAAITPSFAYQVTDKLSLGIGVSAIYTLMDQEIAIRQGAPDPQRDASIRFDGLSDWGFQGILGLTYEFNERLLLGVVYRSEADTNLDGDVKLQGLQIPLPAAPPSSVKIEWTNPQWLDLGLRYRLNDRTMLFLNGGWQEWSKFSENRLSFREDRVQVIDRNWDDTWYAGIAAIHKLSDRSALSFGFSYDSSPVKDKYRTLDMPLDETWKLSAAYGWQHNDNMSFSLGTTLYFVGDAPVTQSSQGVTVSGDYDTNMLAIVGGTFRYDF